MKTVILLAIVTLSMAGSGFTRKGTWVIDAESQLTLQGFTNVNDFSCKIQYCTGTDTLQYFEQNKTRELRFTRSRMTVPVRSFDCGAKTISRDFWHTLKAESYPNLEINFISLENIFFKERTNIKGVVDISVAGVTARYAIDYEVTKVSNSTILLKGEHRVHFSDFNLQAPKKLKGLIKVKEILDVEFNLLLTEV